MDTRWFVQWWAIVLYAIIIVGVLIGVFWHDSPDNVKKFINTIIDSIKDIVGAEDPKQLEEDDTIINNSRNSSIPKNNTMPTGGGGGGGGSGGSGSENETFVESTLLPEEILTFTSLKALFSSSSQLGHKVDISGLAIKIAGVSTSEHFFFTDDSSIINNPSALYYTQPKQHINVYNPLGITVPQTIIRLTGSIIRCSERDHGKYCVKAETIEIQ